LAFRNAAGKGHPPTNWQTNLLEGSLKISEAISRSGDDSFISTSFGGNTLSMAFACKCRFLLGKERKKLFDHKFFIFLQVGRG